jgi:hypothetical protein
MSGIEGKADMVADSRHVRQPKADIDQHFMLQKRTRFQSAPNKEPARVAQNFGAP